MSSRPSPRVERSPHESERLCIQRWPNTRRSSLGDLSTALEMTVGVDGRALRRYRDSLVDDKEINFDEKHTLKTMKFLKSTGYVNPSRLY